MEPCPESLRSDDPLLANFRPAAVFQQSAILQKAQRPQRLTYPLSA